MNGDQCSEAWGHGICSWWNSLNIWQTRLTFQVQRDFPNAGTSCKHSCPSMTLRFSHPLENITQAYTKFLKFLKKAPAETSPCHRDSFAQEAVKVNATFSTYQTCVPLETGQMQSHTQALFTGQRMHQFNFSLISRLQPRFSEDANLSAVNVRVLRHPRYC